MPAGSHAEGKRRYRANIAAKKLANSPPRRTFKEAIGMGMTHLVDYEAAIQGMQVTQATVIVTCHVPRSYVNDVLEAVMEGKGQLFFRVYMPPEEDLEAEDDYEESLAGE